MWIDFQNNLPVYHIASCQRKLGKTFSILPVFRENAIGEGLLTSVRQQVRGQTSLSRDTEDGAAVRNVFEDIFESNCH